jgi:hypothetical protein
MGKPNCHEAIMLLRPQNLGKTGGNGNETAM